MPLLTRIFIEILIISLLSYIGFGFYLYLFQNKILYYPDKQDFELCQSLKDSQKINFKGTRFYYKNNSDKVIVFYHGNAGSACDRSFLGDEFQYLGYSYIIVEYAGYSNDSRKPGKDLLMQDVRNINDFLKTINYSDLVLMGNSIGSYLASYHSSIADYNKLVLISSFDNILDIARDKFPFYPMSLMLKENYNNGELLAGADNVLFIHGGKDTIIPIKYSKDLYKKIKTKNKNFVEIKAAGHNDLYSNVETFEALRDFLQLVF